MAERSASELARETLRLLATRRLPPNPANFAAIYHEIAGDAPVVATGAVDAAGTGTGSVPAAGPAGTVAAMPVGGVAERQFAEFAEQVARLLEFTLPALEGDDPRVATDTEALAAACREPIPSGGLAALRTRLANYNHRLSFIAEDQGSLRSGLLGLLQLVFANIAELSLDDRWLHGQVELLMQASAPPLSLRRLEDVQRRLKDVILKQGELKRAMLAAQEDTKQLIASFIGRLSELADSSGSRGARIEQCARRIEAAQDLAAVRPALSEALSATRQLAEDAARARQDLGQMRQRAAASEAELERLRRELDSVSEASRHDALTGLLNRRGLDEAMAAEIPRLQQRGAGLALALLDIDDFKRINDRHGHPAGDAALAHLAGVARAAIPARCTLSRMGGEEFVVLMPDTSLEQGVEVMHQLQRELTRHYFLADGARLLITFSAGVTLLEPGEQPRHALERADQCMYQAKRNGKNRVFAR